MFKAPTKVRSAIFFIFLLPAIQCYAESETVSSVYLKMTSNLIKDDSCGLEQYILQRPDELANAGGEAYMTNATDTAEVDFYADGRGLGIFKWLSLVAVVDSSIKTGGDFPNIQEKQFLCVAKAYQMAVEANSSSSHLRSMDEAAYKKAISEGEASFDSSKYKNTIIATKEGGGDSYSLKFKMEPLS